MACATYTSLDQLPLVLTVDQLSDVLGIGTNKAYELVRGGRVRSVRVGWKYKIPKMALEEYLSPQPIE